MPSTAARSATAASEAWSMIGRLFGRNRGRFFSVCREFELSPPQVMALRHMDPERPLPMSELAGSLHCDNSNVTGIVDRLEDRGLVERRAADYDRRVKLLALTPDGEALREKLGERMDEPPPQLAALSAADQRALRDILRRALGE
jgi:DNA-binding MarR family transcriptional regulator